MRILSSLLAFAMATGAQIAPAAYQTIPQPCDAVRPAADLLLQDRGFTVQSATACATCVVAQTGRLQDAAGHRLLSNRKIIEHYTTKSLRREKVGPFVQNVHVGLTVQAQMHLLPTGDECQADLRFTYAWYGAQMILGFPVDGDPAHGDSNGKLEAAYLQALQHHFESPVAKH